MINPFDEERRNWGECAYCEGRYYEGDLYQDWGKDDICKVCIDDTGRILCLACRTALDPEEKGQIYKRGGKYFCGKCGEDLELTDEDVDGYDIEERGDE